MKEALKLALEALEELNNTNSYWWQEVDKDTIDKIDPTIIAIKEALAQPDQEPVAYLCENAVGHKYFRWKKPSSTYKPVALYTTPPQRTWVGLTIDEVKNLCLSVGAEPIEVRLIEAKLKEKNT